MKNICTLILFIFFQVTLFGQIVIIEDVAFKSYLIESGYDSNGDGQIQLTEANAIEEVLINDVDIVSISGIEQFANLKVFTLLRSNIDRIDLSGSVSLEEFEYSTEEPISIINLQDCINLFTFVCRGGDNQTDSIDLKNCKSLTDAIFYAGSAIRNIDFSNCTNLTSLSIFQSKAESINLDGCDKLESVNFVFRENNSLELSFQSLPSLQRITLIGSIDNLIIDDLPELTDLNYSDEEDIDPLNAVKISNVPKLKNVMMDASLIRRLELKDQSNLERVIMKEGPLNTLNLINCPKLHTVEYGEQPMDTLNLKGATSLTNVILGTDIEYVDLSNCLSMSYLGTEFGLTIINSLNCSGMQSLSSLHIEYGVDNINLEGCFNLASAFFGINNRIKNLDLSACAALQNVNLGQAVELESLVLNNGAQETIELDQAPKLIDVCIDGNEENYYNTFFESKGINVNLSTSCLFTNPMSLHKISGKSLLDVNNDTCRTSNKKLTYAKYKLISDNNVESFFFTNEVGEYNYFLPEGAFTYSPELVENLEAYTSLPEQNTITVPGTTFVTEVDFCYFPTQNLDFIDLTLIPLEPARPGYDASYRIIYANFGNDISDGDIILEFQNEVLELVSSEPNINLLETGLFTWSFQGLEPYETRTIDFVMNLNSPMETPPLDGQSTLEYIASVSSSNNSSKFLQQVVNSFDPNDKTCLNGDVLNLEDVGDYLKYMIRFENTGSAEAINIVVMDTIDLNSFDISTLEVIVASHDIRTSIEGNVVKFIFDDIMLPFEDAFNDGYVTFKIKTLPHIDIEHEIKNNAGIFFDFNFPIITNTTTTTVKEVTATNDFEIDDASFQVFPNPTSENIHIILDGLIDKIEIVDIHGNLIGIEVITGKANEYVLGVNDWQAGVYILNVFCEKSVVSRKIIIQ